MKNFPTLQKLDLAVLYGMELASSLSVVLLSIGVIASMSNTLTDGWLLGSNIAISRTWIISQTVAMDTGLIVSIVRAFVMAKSKRWLQCSLYAALSILLLSTTAIVSNIESIQQTLGITLEKAYTYSPIPLVWLVSMRSLCVILLIVAHALKYVSADSSPSEPMAVAAPEAETPIEQSSQPEQEIEITEGKNDAELPFEKEITGRTLPAEKEKPKALPSPKKRTAIADNLERVRVYMTEHKDEPKKVSVRQVAKDLNLGISTANKWMRKVSEQQIGGYTHE